MPTILERYRETFSKDRELALRDSTLLPDGVSSDSRVMTPFPMYADRAAGSKKWSVSGVELIDYWSGHGALLLGHNPPEMIAAVTAQVQRGTHYGACHPFAADWAALVTELIPGAERVRFTGSGTEANLIAIRLARTFTGKNKVLRLIEHYHGWQDTVYQGIEGPVETVPGIPEGVNETTVVCPPNDLHAIENVLANDPDIACVILEPTGPCSGVVPLNDTFLRPLRDLTRTHGVVLIFDEIVTGFRVAPGGAQAHYQVLPDLTTLAKILAGGLPGGAVTGKKEIMDLLSVNDAPPGRKVPHLGTYNANPLSACAGIAVLNTVKTGVPQQKANHAAKELRDGLNRIIDAHGLDWVVYGEFSMLKFLVGHGDRVKARDFDPYKWDYRKLTARGNRQLWATFRLGMLVNGVDLSLSSATMAAHSAEDIQKTLVAFEQTLAWMRSEQLI